MEEETTVKSDKSSSSSSWADQAQQGIKVLDVVNFRELDYVPKPNPPETTSFGQEQQQQRQKEQTTNVDKETFAERGSAADASLHIPSKESSNNSNGHSAMTQSSPQRRRSSLSTHDNTPLCIVPPHSCDPLQDLEHLQILQDLKRLDEFLRNPTTRERLMVQEGIREIQMHRYEIFLEAADKPTDAIDWALRILSISKAKIIDYCIQQAKKDKRTKHLETFGNFSIIVNYDVVEHQTPHIDLLYPNFQFGLILTDRSPGTYVYNTGRTITTARDLKEQWRDMSDRLVGIIESSPEATTLLKHFGAVLADKLEIYPQPESHPTGTCLCLPGSILHAGPKSGPRSVLFFSGAPQVSLQYHPDTQYFDSLLLADLIQMIWNKCGNAERYFLLLKLANLVYTGGIKNLARHLDKNPVRDFCARLPATWNADKLQKIIRQFCHKTPFMQPVGYLDHQGVELKQVSMPGLCTIFEEKTSDIIVYQAGSEFRLFYTADESWEGIHKNYQLRRTNNATDPFDGTNGILMDDEGNEIVCFLPLQHRGVKRPHDDT